MRLYYHVDPDKLSLDTLCKMRCELEWLMDVGGLGVKIDKNR